MAIVTLQVAVGTTAKQLVTVPPGASAVALFATGTNTIYVGAGGTTNLSTLTGYPLIGGLAPVVIPGYATSGGTTLYALANAAGSVVGVILSTAESGTGL